MSEPQPSNSSKLKTTATALTGFYSATSTSDANVDKPATNPFLLKKKKKSRSTLVSLELIRNLSTDLKTPQEMAAGGDLDGLKAYCEVYGFGMKERDEHQATLLHHAATTNQVEVMQYLIDSGIDLNATDKDGHTALHVAVLQGHVDALNLLLDSGIDDTILNKDKDAALHISARSPNTDTLAAFLQHPEIDLVVTGYRKRTPLHIVSQIDNLPAAEVIHNSVLVQEQFKKKTGFRLCAADEDDLTPIHLAARMGSHRVLDFFMSKCKEHGYPPEVVLGFIDEENSTPLHAAIDGGHSQVVKVLLKHGADPLVLKDDQIPPFLLACSQGRLEMIETILQVNTRDAIACTDVYGHSCLHHSGQAINSNQVISFLVKKGAPLDTLNNKGQTPLMMSIIAGSTCGVATLLKLGADPLIKDSKGCNILHYTVIQNRRKISSMLLELPCASTLVVDVDNERNSPIHHALKLARCQFVTPMIHVIQYKLKNIKDCNGNNYLHLAAFSGNWRALSILLEIVECYKLLNETNNGGLTPLHSAALNGHTRCVEVLLSHGAMIHKCHCGLTPFMCCCINGHAEAARVLFSAHPFQLRWSDDKGRNALHLGAQSGNPELIIYLLDIGIPITHNYARESFFEILIDRNDTKSAAAVIEHERYEECLDLVSSIRPHPMLNLIIHMPEIARKVLDRSFTKANLTRAHPEYWEKFDFQYLHLKGSFREAESEDIDGEKKQLMADQQSMKSHVIKYKGSVKESERPVTGPVSKSCSKLAHLETVRLMVKHDRGLLLTHPVSNAYLKSKWRSYGRWAHIILSAFVFFQVLFLSLFTALIPNPSVIQASFNNEGINCTNGTNGTSNCPEFSVFSNACRFISIGFAALNTIIWLGTVVQVRMEALNIVKNHYVFIDLMSVIFTVYYLIPTNGLHTAHWEAGAVAVFFAWFSLILRIQLFDLFGVYITMFLAITRRAFQVLLICFLFILSFGLSFYILTGNLKQYSTIGYSLFLNFGHLLGEIDYETFVAEDVEGNLQFSWLTYMFVISLAILMAIVIMNLLIGLAVGDIDEIRSNAIAEKKSNEVNFFSKIDILIPSRLLKRLNQPFHISYPNHPTSIMKRVWRFCWQAIKGEDASLSDDDDTKADKEVEQKIKDITKLKEKVEELTMSQDRLHATLNQMKEVQESMMKMMMTLNAERESEDDSDK